MSYIVGGVKLMVQFRYSPLPQLRLHDELCMFTFTYFKKPVADKLVKSDCNQFFIRFWENTTFEICNFLASALMYDFHYAKTFNKVLNLTFLSFFIILLILINFGVSLDESQHIYFINKTRFFSIFQSFFRCQRLAGT